MIAGLCAIPRPTALRRAALVLGVSVPCLPAQGSFLEGPALDAVASVLALIVIFVVPVVAIVLFWMVHVLPEKIAHKRHHPQTQAIQTLCLLSLVFGGLLWPIAWLWAYTKPVGYKLAYGTDKHPDYFKEHGIEDPDSPTADLRLRIAGLEASGISASELEAIRADLAAIESRLTAATGSGVR